jgi:hypothetical protein
MSIETSIPTQHSSTDQAPVPSIGIQVQPDQELVLHSLDWELEDTTTIPEHDEIVIEDDTSKELVPYEKPTGHPLADIVDVDTKGRAHHAKGLRSLKTDKETGEVLRESETQGIGGRFLTKYELEQIEAHAGQIREGLGKHERLIGLIALDSRGLGHRANGQIISREEVKVLNAERRAKLIAEQKAEAELGLPTPTEEDVNNGGAGRWAKIKGWASRKKAELYSAVSNPVGYLKERTSEKSRKEKIIAGAALGALCLGAAGLVMYLSSRHGMQAELPSGTGTGPRLGGPETADIFHGGTRMPAHMDSVPGLEQVPLVTPEHIASLAKGDTVWALAQHSAEQTANLKLDDAQVQMITQHTLDMNNMTWEQARHLPVGAQFRLMSSDEIKAVLGL